MRRKEATLLSICEPYPRLLMALSQRFRSCTGTSVLKKTLGAYSPVRAAGKAARAAAAIKVLVGAAAGAAITATGTHSHTGEMTTTTTAVGEIGVVHTDPHGIGQDGACGTMAPPHQTHVTAVGL